MSDSLKRTSDDTEETSEEPLNKIPKQDLSNCVCSTLSSKIASLEEKLDKQNANNRILLDNMNGKMDKLIRLLSDLTENEGKAAKKLTVLTKIVEKLEENGANSRIIERMPAIEDHVTAKIDSEENSWAQDVFLLGDELFTMILKVPDVKDKLDKMKKAYHLTVRVKDKIKIGNLYDRSRDKFIFPVPSKISTVVLSIGGQDLFDETIITLRQASLEEVKQTNKAKLKERAGHIKGMIQKLINQGMSVVYIVPTTSVQRNEVFQQFEEILNETVSDLPFPEFKLLNFPELIRSTTDEFASKEDHLKTWFSDLRKSALSDYGCRRLLEAIKSSVMAKRRMNGCQNYDQEVCKRCTRQHQGGSEGCRSKNMICRRCGLVGHFVDVHDIVDPGLQRQIVLTLGVDIYGKELGNPQPAESLNHWYHADSSNKS